MQFLLPIFFSLKKRCQDVKVTTVFLQRVQRPGFKVFGLTEKQDARRGDDVMAEWSAAATCTSRNFWTVEELYNEIED